jgi:DNA-binding NarL/FixJ family response regulator
MTKERTSEQQAKVLIVDDHQMVRRGIRQLLAHAFEVVGEAAEGGESLERARCLRPDVVLMDVALPGMDGIEATRSLKRELPDMQVVMISASDEEQQVLDAIGAGACSYVVKTDSASAIVEAVGAAARGEVYLPPNIALRVLNHAARRDSPAEVDREELSSREREVLRLMAIGRRSREIATELFISERTVGNHIAAIYKKLGINSRAAAVTYAVRTGMIRV